MLLLACEKEQNLEQVEPLSNQLSRSSVSGGFDYALPADVTDKQLVLEKVQQLESRYDLYTQDSLTPGATANIAWENGIWYAEALYNFLSRYENWPDGKYADFSSPVESSASVPFTVANQEAFVSEADIFTLMDELTDYTGQDIAPTTNLSVSSVNGSNLVVGISRIPIKAEICQVDPIQSTDEIKAIACEECLTTNAPRKCLSQFFFDAMQVNCHSEALEWFYNVDFMHIGARPINGTHVSTPDPSLYYVLAKDNFDPVTFTSNYQSVGSGTNHKDEFWGASTALIYPIQNNPATCLTSSDLTNYINKAESVITTEQNSLSSAIWYAFVNPRNRDLTANIDFRHSMNLFVATQGLTPGP